MLEQRLYDVHIMANKLWVGEKLTSSAQGTTLCQLLRGAATGGGAEQAGTLIIHSERPGSLLLRVAN